MGLCQCGAKVGTQFKAARADEEVFGVAPLFHEPYDQECKTLLPAPLEDKFRP
mgnify:CR=1 FL=1